MTPSNLNTNLCDHEFQKTLFYLSHEAVENFRGDLAGVPGGLGQLVFGLAVGAAAAAAAGPAAQSAAAAVHHRTEGRVAAAGATSAAARTTAGRVPGLELVGQIVDLAYENGK